MGSVPADHPVGLSADSVGSAVSIAGPVAHPAALPGLSVSLFLPCSEPPFSTVFLVLSALTVLRVSHETVDIPVFPCSFKPSGIKITAYIEFTP